jgi:hypothetical protein
MRIAHRTNSTIEDTEKTMSRTQINAAISGFSNRNAQNMARNYIAKQAGISEPRAKKILMIL